MVRPILVKLFCVFCFRLKSSVLCEQRTGLEHETIAMVRDTLFRTREDFSTAGGVYVVVLSVSFSASQKLRDVRFPKESYRLF